MEILVVGAILLFIFFYNNTIDKEKFIADNEKYLEVFKEDDYTFLLYAKYGDDVDVDQIYMKRCTQSIVVFLVVFVLSIGGSSTGGQNIILNAVFAAIIAIVIFK